MQKSEVESLSLSKSLSSGDDDTDNSIDEEEEPIIELTPRAQRLAMAMLCYYDFVTGRKHYYIDDASVFFDIDEFLIKQSNVSEFLVYVLNYTSFLSSEVCNYFIKMGCDIELVNAKNLEFLNDEINVLSDVQLKMAKISLDNFMRFEEGMPRGNNTTLFGRLKLSNRELLIISAKAVKSGNQTIYLDLITDDLTTDDANHYLLNDYQVDYIIKNWPIEKYINYLAVFADNNNLQTALINRIAFDNWKSCPADIKSVAKTFSVRTALMAYKERLNKK
jgi:hypothetical protein